MSKQKYTPGPWVINYAVSYSINSAKGDKHIAMVSCYKEKAYDEIENEANTKLIAAAPELLEACEMTLQFFVDNNRNGTYQLLLRRIIAKAKGKTGGDDATD